MEWKPRMWPTFAAELLRARASLRIGDEVGLALRADRQRLGLSQRAYAERRGWTLGTVIRLESAADALKLGDVDAALEDTPFMLCLCHRPTSPDSGVGAHAVTGAGAGGTEPAPSSAEPVPPRSSEPDGSAVDPSTPSAAPMPVHPAFWPRAELIARVRGGRRRFPAHHVTEQVDSGPPWWWYAESSRAGSTSPDWYAPQHTRRGRAAS